MPRYACTGCGAISPQRKCQRCAPNPANPTSWNGQRDRGAQARFRKHVLRNAGYRCQYVSQVNGTRCPAVDELQAHHLETGNDDPLYGMALCRNHHRAVDRSAR